jgi:pilus assembly protein Flp/PilA
MPLQQASILSRPCLTSCTTRRLGGGLGRLVLKYSLLKFISDETGATAIEYGLIAAGISIAILAAVNGLGSNLNTMFNSINTSLK